MSGTPSALLSLGVPLRSATPLSATLEPVGTEYVVKILAMKFEPKKCYRKKIKNKTT